MQKLRLYSLKEILNFQSFFVIINSDGKTKRTPTIANIIASDVNIPNKTVGIKLDKLNIEKPSAIVIDVVNTAKPALEFVNFIDSNILFSILNSL